MRYYMPKNQELLNDFKSNYLYPKQHNLDKYI